MGTLYEAVASSRLHQMALYLLLGLTLSLGPARTVHGQPNIGELLANN